MPRLGVLGFATVLIGAAVALPVVSVLASFFAGAGDTWQHLATTALPRYVGNTLALLLLVSAGVISMGVVSAWLVSSPAAAARECFRRSAAARSSRGAA